MTDVIPSLLNLHVCDVHAKLFSASFRYALEYENSFHAKFQCKFRKPKKFLQMFLDGCHAGLLCKVKRDPAPFESRILSASMEAHWNYNNTGCRHVVFWQPGWHATLTKGSRALGTLADAHG